MIPIPETQAQGWWRSVPPAKLLRASSERRVPWQRRPVAGLSPRLLYAGLLLPLGAAGRFRVKRFGRRYQAAASYQARRALVHVLNRMRILAVCLEAPLVPSHRLGTFPAESVIDAGRDDRSQRTHYDANERWCLLQEFTHNP